MFISIIGRAAIDFIEFRFKFVIVFLVDIQVVIQFFEKFELQLMQMQGVDSSSELKSLIIVVEVVLILGCKQNCGQDEFMDVEAVE